MWSNSLQLIEWLAIVNMVQTVKKMHYFLLLYDVVKLTSTQMVIGNCEHVANSKETVLFFAILYCGPTDFNSKGHLVL